jgi:phosphoribosylglycinamide formyltransferase-1
MKKRIAIFASGSGSNAQKIMEHFKRSSEAEVVLVLTNNPQAYVLQRADNFEIPSHIFTRKEFYQSDDVIRLLKNLQVDLIVLAGFLWLVPETLLHAFPNKIINLHEGEVIHQSKFKIEPDDNLEVVKFKGQQLEHQYFPKVIEGLLKKMKS